jgi:orotate phosphoribosyltransferase
LTNLDTLLDVGVSEERLSSSDRDVVTAWRSSPKEWDRSQKDDFRSLEQCKQAVAKMLFESEAVQIRTNPPFDYASGGKGPIYTDNRILLGRPLDREFIIQTMTDLVAREIGIQNIDCIGAIATAGISFSNALADALKLPMVIVNSTAPNHGLKSKIDGKMTPGLRVLLLEDLVNRGGSTLKAMTILRSAGAIVGHCMALFTYGLKDTQAKFDEHALRLITLSDLDTLLQVGVDENLISQADRELVQDWANEPHAWSERFAANQR